MHYFNNRFKIDKKFPPKFLRIHTRSRFFTDGDKWTLVYFCDGYVSLDGLAANELARTRCRNWMGYFAEDCIIMSLILFIKISN